MTRRLTVSLLLLVLVAPLGATRSFAVDGQPVAVEPEDLTKRQDLIGREVVVDDRVSRFQYHRETGFDEIYLKRAPEVAFELPPRLLPSSSPSVVAIVIRGILRHDEGRFHCEVSSYERQPADLDRLNHAIAQLPKLQDADTRLSWASWAERRAKAFGDEVLLKRAKEIEGDAIRLEAEKPKAAGAPGEQWLALADRARARQVPEPEPSALAHRGFRAAIASAQSAEDLKKLADRISQFFPRSGDVPASSVDLSRWERSYATAPADAYRAASRPARLALDHRLWADVQKRWLERRASEDPKSLLSLADEAGKLLPDRPEVASDFLERGLASATSDVGSLRQGEVENLATLYRVTLKNPDKARDLYRAWLNDQKDRRLSARDAGGRLALADQYENLIDDRATAVILLRQAWAIDPQSREVDEAFRRRGYRKIQGEWIEGSKTTSSTADAPAAETTSRPAKTAEATSEPATQSESLRGLTPDEVKSRMGGRPNRRIWLASQGQLIEQWIYTGTRLDQNQYVNFLRRAGESQSHVVSYYSLPRVLGDTPAHP